jgi:hypothetical protein
MCAACLALLLGGEAAAQTLAEADGAAAMGLAGACATVVRDPGAIWGNPALISEASRSALVGLRLQNLTRAVQRITVSPVPEARDTAGVQLAPTVALAIPLWRSHLWIAAGYHMALQVESRYPPAVITPSMGAVRPASARYRGLESDIDQHLVSVGLAARFRWLAAGAVLELSHVRFRHRMALWAGYEADFQNARFEREQLDADAVLDGSNRLAVGARFGVWIQPLRYLAAGVALGLPAAVHLSGQWTLKAGTEAPKESSAIAAQGVACADSGACSGPARVDLHLPLRLRGGVAVGPPRLRVVLEGGLARWSPGGEVTAQLQDASFAVKPKASAEEVVALESLPLAIELRDTFSVHAGLELVPWPGFLTVRTGYSYQRGATAPEAPSSTVLDLDRHTWGIGIEATHGRLRFAAAVAQSFEETILITAERAVAQNPLDPAVTQSVGAGRYTTSSLRILLEVQVGF